MKKRNLFFAIGGILGAVLDAIFIYIAIVLSLLLKSCVGENGDTTVFDIISSAICLILVLSFISAIITIINSFKRKTVSLAYITIQQIVHILVSVAVIYMYLVESPEIYYILVIAMCMVVEILYLIGTIFQKKNKLQL